MRTLKPYLYGLNLPRTEQCKDCWKAEKTWLNDCLRHKVWSGRSMLGSSVPLSIFAFITHCCQWAAWLAFPKRSNIFSQRSLDVYLGSCETLKCFTYLTFFFFFFGLAWFFCCCFWVWFFLLFFFEGSMPLYSVRATCIKLMYSGTISGHGQ